MSVTFVHSPKLKDESVVQFSQGGFGSRSITEAIQNLDAITNGDVNKPFGPVRLNEMGFPTALPLDYRSFSMPCLTGNTEILNEDQLELAITNYDSFVSYHVAATGGTARIRGDMVQFTPDTTSIVGGVTVNGVHFPIQIRAPQVLMPLIDDVQLNLIDEHIAATITASEFDVLGGEDTHLASDWQIATDRAFTDLVDSVQASTTALEQWTATGLETGTGYYARVRYYGATLLQPSDWSPTLEFTTSEMGDVVGLAGPSEVIIRTTAGFTILGYNENNLYRLTTSPGITANRVGNQILLDPPLNLGSYWINVNGVQKTFQVTPYYATVTGLGNVGPIEMNKTRELTIEPYVDYATYLISASSGTNVVRNGAALLVTASPIAGEAWVEVNGFRAVFGITYPKPQTPTLTVFQQETREDLIRVTIDGSAFVVDEFIGTHQATQWELSTNPNFTDSALWQGEQVGLKRCIYDGLEPNTTYYARARYLSSTGTQSEYGLLEFRTTAWGVVTQLQGDNSLTAGSSKVYIIVGYEAGKPYRVLVGPGASYVRSGDSIVFTAASSGQSSFLEVNGVVKNLTLNYPIPATPVLSHPAMEAYNDKVRVSFTTSAFSTDGNVGTHHASDWNISQLEDFSVLDHYSIGSTTNKTTWQDVQLKPQTDYFVRVRHHSSGGTMSAWAVRPFTTTAWGIVANLSGPSTVEAGSRVKYTIDGYESNKPYQVTASEGSEVERYGNEVYITVATTGETGWLDVNGSNVNFSVTYPKPDTPSINEPAQDVDGDIINVSFTSSNYRVPNNAGSHANSDWQLATDSNFVEIIRSTTASPTNKLSWSASNLEAGRTYYVRTRHRSSGNAASEWGIRPFTTAPLGAVGGISGPDVVYGGPVLYTIDGYQAGRPYVITGSPDLTWTRFNSAVTVTFPSGEGPRWFEINGVRKDVTLMIPKPSTPIMGEVALSVELNDELRADFHTSEFNMEGGYTHLSTDWDLALDSEFNNVIFARPNQVGEWLTWMWKGNLEPGTTYFIRARHRASNNEVSDWAITSFTTAALGPVSSIIGPNEIELNDQADYEIAGYQNGRIYRVTMNPAAVTFTRNGGIITVNAGAIERNATLTVNGIGRPISIVQPRPRKTTINSPNYTVGDGGNVTASLTTAPFAATNPTLTHLNTDWELAHDVDFSNIKSSSMASGGNLTSWSVSELIPGTTYYLRVRHRANNGNAAEWTHMELAVKALGPVASISGPSQVDEGQSATYTIGGYEPSLLYWVKVTGDGSGSLGFNGLINFTAATSLSADGEATITVNGEHRVITVKKTSPEGGDD